MYMDGGSDAGNLSASAPIVLCAVFDPFAAGEAWARFMD